MYINLITIKLYFIQSTEFVRKIEMRLVQLMSIKLKHRYIILISDQSSIIYKDKKSKKLTTIIALIKALNQTKCIK